MTNSCSIKKKRGSFGNQFSQIVSLYLEMEGDPHPIVVASEEESKQDVSLEIFVKKPGEDMSVTYMHWWRGRRCGA